MNSEPIYPSEYRAVDDLWVVSAYFNPLQYQSRRRNFDLFYAYLRESGLNHIIVECATGNDTYHIDSSPNVIRVKSETILWHKERLLNIAFAALPAKCKKVAWVDCDILFDNADWAVETSAALDYYKVVQPFSVAISLPKGEAFYSGEGARYFGFCAAFQENPAVILDGHFFLHGHPGFAWAARKEVFRNCGLYEACIMGGADEVMAHAFCGDWEMNSCFRRLFQNNVRFYRHFVQWSEDIYPRVRSRVSYVPGTILHLWHGCRENRNYVNRADVLSVFNYDPIRHLRVNCRGGLECDQSQTQLAAQMYQYFIDRQEDA